MSKILFFSPHDLPGAHITRNFDYAKRLVRKGHEVEIIANNFSHRDKIRVEPPGATFFAKTTAEGVKVVWLNTTKYETNGFSRALNAFSYFCLAMRYVLNEKQTVDFCIGDSVPPTAGLAAYLSSKIKKSQFIFQIRDVWPIELVYIKAIKKYSFTFLVLRLLEIFLYKVADKIYSALPQIESHIKESGSDVRKIVYIPNGVDLSKFQYKTPVPSSSGQFRIVYAGGFGHAHDAASIVIAAKLLFDDDKRLLFDFYGDGLKLADCKKLKESLSLENVQFHDSIDKDRLSAKLSDTEILIAAVTDSEVYKFGFNSNKIYDYLASGRPIIFAMKSPFRLIEEANCGFTVPPENPQEIANAIRRIYLMTPSEREAMGLNGRKYAETHYDIDKLANKFEANLIS